MFKSAGSILTSWAVVGLFTANHHHGVWLILYQL